MSYTVKFKTPGETPSLDGLVNFQRGQVKLLDGYRYPLNKADRLLATHRTEVNAYAQQVLGQLEAGKIESWQQLIDQDFAFMQRHR